MRRSVNDSGGRLSAVTGRTGYAAHIALAALLAATAALYWPGLAGPILLDDYHNLELLIAMESGVFDWREVLASRPAGLAGRHVAMLTFIGNWLATGGDAWYLKLTNLVVHLLCGALVFWLTARLARQPLVGVVGAGRWWIALWVAALWLLAPLFVSTVLYIVQRMAQLSALFGLAGLLCYVAGREQLAAFSKQNGALLPLLVLVVELFFFSPPESRGDRRLVRGGLGALVAAPALAALAVSLADPQWSGISYRMRDFTLYERLLTQSRILFDYVANLLLIPGGSAMGLFHDDYRVSKGLLDPPSTALAVIAWLAVLVAAWRLRGSRAGVLAFGPVFFLAAHSLESSVFPLELYFEHRNYLPAVGLFVSLGLAAHRLVTTAVRARALLLGVLALIPLGFGVVTAHRVLVWQSWEGILLAAQRNHPDSPRVHTGLASLYINRDETERALAHLDRAETLYGDRHAYAIALNRLAAYCFSERPVPEDAYDGLEALGEIDDGVYTVNTLAWLAGAAERGECARLDLDRVAAALADTVRHLQGEGGHRANWALHLYTAKLLAEAGRKREAVAHLRDAAALRPEWLEAGLLEVRYLLDLRDEDGARRALEELKRRDRGKYRLHTELIERFERLLADKRGE